MAQQPDETTGQVSRSGPIIWVYGTPKKLLEPLTVAPYNAILIGTEDLPNGMQASDSAAAVELEKNYIREADLIFVDVTEGYAESFMTIQYAWSLGKAAVVAISPRTDIAWISSHTSGIFTDLECALSFLKALIYAHEGLRK